MAELKPLIPILIVVLAFSIGFGYLNAYAGPLLAKMLSDMGATTSEIGMLLSVLYVVRVIADLAVVTLVAFVAYHYGKEYRITLMSGLVFVILLYVTGLLGSLIGSAFYQIQTPQYPVFLAALPQTIAGYGFVLAGLVGILAANYSRESTQHGVEPVAPYS